MNDVALRAQNEGEPDWSGAATEATSPQRASSPMALIGVASVGAALALSLGIYGRLHTPTGLVLDPIRPENMLQFKSIVTSIGAGLALFQLLSAWWLFGRRPFSGNTPSWVGPAHRWSGTAAFVATLPAGYHCLWSLGFQTTTTRVVIHSLLGCAFYGAFATKMLALRSDRMPGWAIPVVGATVVTLLVALWFSSALWFFTGSL